MMSISAVCVFDTEIFDELFGDIPTQERIGYIDIDGDGTFSLAEESFYIDQEIPSNSIVHVLCKNW